MSRVGGAAWSELRPLPSRAWIHWSPVAWPASATPSTDLTRAGVILAAEAGAALPADLPEVPEVIYLPPVPADLESERTGLALRALEAGHAVIWQRAPGGTRPPAGARDIVDLLPTLLAGVWPEAGALRGADLAIWPLLGGARDELLAELEAGVEVLVRAAVPALLGVQLEMDAGERRALAERGGERLFDRLFHAAPLPPREVACECRRRGLAWGMSRPAVAVPPTVARNREAAAHLAVAAELWSVARRPEGAGAELWRAAREAEGFPRDLAALAREGRLGFVPWLGATAREVVEAWASGRPQELLARLEAEWLGEGEGMR